MLNKHDTFNENQSPKSQTYLLKLLKSSFACENIILGFCFQMKMMPRQKINKQETTSYLKN